MYFVCIHYRTAVDLNTTADVIRISVKTSRRTCGSFEETLSAGLHLQKRAMFTLRDTNNIRAGDFEASVRVRVESKGLSQSAGILKPQ